MKGARKKDKSVFLTSTPKTQKIQEYLLNSSRKKEENNKSHN